MKDRGPYATAIRGVGQSVQSAGEVYMYVGVLENLAELVEGEADVALLTGIDGFAAEFQSLAAEAVLALDEMYA